MRELEPIYLIQIINLHSKQLLFSFDERFNPYKAREVLKKFISIIIHLIFVYQQAVAQ